MDRQVKLLGCGITGFRWGDLAKRLQTGNGNRGFLSARYAFNWR